MSEAAKKSFAVRIACADCPIGPVWAPVAEPPYGDRYEVSSHGDVRSVDILITDSLGRARRQTGRVLKHTICDFGYHRVELRSGGRETRRSFAVHRLVAKAFLGDPPSDDHEVLHLDHDVDHNHLGNLKWGTHGENVRASVKDGRHRSGNHYKTRCPQGHRYTKRNSRGDRVCYECIRARQRKYNARRRPGVTP